MKAVIQRVSSASVKIDKQIISKIGKGLLILLGISEIDNQQDIDIMVDKIKNLRIFPDASGKMNISIKDIDGEILAVSQFTLLADLQKGRRPSFVDAAQPVKAECIYKQVIDNLRKEGIKVESGRFREYMQVELVNDGPATFIFDTKKKLA
ncbi:MAG: D-tyrosyl-tRNA(Tyr) deacylase [Candidatus Omnitrophica bacterium]|nr:D-tyrosyl-tRNA(Tyr) deacylase [Candidatus Omnitrophota bacterium]